MFQNGSLVTLSAAKTHGEGDDAVRLQAGVCGMVARGERKKDNNHLYVVEFGAYGGWYCHHNELSGDDKEGWDGDQDEEREAITINWRDVPQPIRTEEDEDQSAPEEEMVLVRDDLSPSPNLDDFLSHHPEEDASEYIAPKIDIERDIQRRMEEIEKGNCYDAP